MFFRRLYSLSHGLFRSSWDVHSVQAPSLHPQTEMKLTMHFLWCACWTNTYFLKHSKNKLLGSFYQFLKLFLINLFFSYSCHNIIFFQVYNIVIRYSYMSTLWSNQPDKSSIYLTPYIVNTILNQACTSGNIPTVVWSF